MTFLEVEGHSEIQGQAIVGKLNDLYQSAVRKRQKYTDTWRRNYLLAMNKWGPTDGAPRDSEIFPIMRSRVAWMTDQEINFSIQPATDPFSTYADFEGKIGEHLEAVLHTNWKVRNWSAQIVMAIWDAGLYGAGILKGVWDSGLDGGIGNATMERVDPWIFYPDPNATSFDDCQFFFQKHKWSLDEIERRFPNLSTEVIEDAVKSGDRGDLQRRPNNEDFPKYARDGIPTNLGQGPAAFGPPGQGTSYKSVLENGVNVMECWIRENEFIEREGTDPLLPDDEEVVIDSWRVIIYTGNVVLLNELAKDLWEEDRHPFVRYVDDEMGEFWGTPIVSHLAPLQLQINRLLAMLDANAGLVSNPIFMDVEGSGINRTQIVNRPGQRLTLKGQVANMAGGTKPSWLVPPPMPSTVMDLIQFAITRMENISGLSGTSKGQQPAGRQAQATVQATQEAGFVSIRSSLRNLEGMLNQMGEILTNLIIVNYDTYRIVAIVGQEGEQTALRLAANHFMVPTKDGLAPLKFQLLVDAGSSKPTSRQARIAEIDALKAMGAVDNETLLQAHQIPHRDQIMERMAQEAKAAAEAQAQAKGPGTGHGQPTGPGTGHAHISDASVLPSGSWEQTSILRPHRGRIL